MKVEIVDIEDIEDIEDFTEVAVNFFVIVFLNQIDMYLRSTDMNLVFLPN